MTDRVLPATQEYEDTRLTNSLKQPRSAIILLKRAQNFSGKISSAVCPSVARDCRMDNLPGCPPFNCVTVSHQDIALKGCYGIHMQNRALSPGASRSVDANTVDLNVRSIIVQRESKI